MPKTKPTRPELPSDDLVLAAIDRAICHHGDDRSAESLSSIKQHLELPHNGWTTLKLRPRLDALEADGLIEKSRRHSVSLWGLTPKGRQRLGAVRSKLTLPESPQHRRWREAREAAAERIEEIRADVRVAFVEASTLLEAEPPANSGAWFSLSEKLHEACRRLASATYCHGEWDEPDDASPDVDAAPYLQQGRREIHRWAKR